MRWRDREPQLIAMLIVLIYIIFFFFASFGIGVAADDPSGWVDPYTYTSYYNDRPEQSVIHSFPQVVYDGNEYVEYVYERVGKNEFWIQCPTSAFHIKTVNTEVWTVDKAEQILSKCLWQLWYYDGLEWIEVEDADSQFWVSEGESSVTVRQDRLMTDGSQFDVTWNFKNIAKATIDFSAGQAGNYSVTWHVEVPKASRYTEMENRLVFSNGSEFLAYLDYYDARMHLADVVVESLGKTGRKAKITFANRSFQRGESVQIDPAASTFYSEAARDGYIRKLGAAYPPPLHHLFTVTPTAVVGQNILINYSITRVFFSFNTSSVNASLTLASVTFKLFIGNPVTIVEFDILIYSGYYGTALALNDWDNCSTYEGVFANTNGLVGSSWYQTGVSTSSLNATGLSQYSLRSSREGTAPTGTEYVSVVMADYAGTSYDPQLIVTYEQEEEEDLGGGVDGVDGEDGAEAGDGEPIVLPKVTIPDWGFWLIIGGLGFVAAASIVAKAPRKSRKYQPQKRASRERKLPKRDKQGRYR